MSLRASRLLIFWTPAPATSSQRLLPLTSSRVALHSFHRHAFGPALAVEVDIFTAVGVGSSVQESRLQKEECIYVHPFKSNED